MKAWFLVFLVGLAWAMMLLMGCAHQEGLKTPGVDRWCSGALCFIHASPEQVNARCSSIQVREPGEKRPVWKPIIIRWDSGETCDPRERPCANACTISSPGRRLRIWFHDYASLIHEKCHADVFLRDEMRYVRGHHDACAGYGVKLGGQFGEKRKR